ncbi:MAG: hypothetical protein AAFV07_07100 [Bacteroidota bacterium]
MRTGIKWLLFIIPGLWLGMTGCPSAPPHTPPDDQDSLVVDRQGVNRVPQKKVDSVKSRELPPNGHRVRPVSVTDSSSLLLIWLDISDLDHTRAVLLDSLEEWIDTQHAGGGGYQIFLCEGKEPLVADHYGGADAIFMSISRDFPDVPLASLVVDQTAETWKNTLEDTGWRALEVKFVISANLYNISREELLFPLYTVLHQEGRPMRWDLFAEATLIPDSSLMERLGQSFSYYQLKPSSEL